MKHLFSMLLLAVLLFPVACTAEESEGKPNDKRALVGSEWTYHFEGTDNFYGQSVTSVSDYTLRFLTDSTGLYLVDSYVIANGTSQSSDSQMDFTYTFDGRNGVITFIFPAGTPSYVRSSMPPQKFVYDAKRQELTWVDLLDPTFEEKYGKMIFRPKK